MKPKFYGGINYIDIIGWTTNQTTTDALIRKDIESILAHGIFKIRARIVNYKNLGTPPPNNQTSIPTWRNAVQIMREYPFTNITYGVTAAFNLASTSIEWVSKRTWPAYRTAVLAEAAWVASLADTRLIFTIGNELERQHFMTISSAAQTGGTVTIVTTGYHGLQTGDTVYVKGITPADYNGTFILTSASTNTFTYTIANTAATSPATVSSTSTVTDFFDDTELIQDYILPLSVDVKALLPNNGITYSVPTGSNGGGLPQIWGIVGVGSLDKLSFNMYEIYNEFVTYLDYITTTPLLAGKVSVSEWGLNSGSSFLEARNDEYLYGVKLIERLERFLDKGLENEIYYFLWRGRSSQGFDGFGLITEAGNPREALSTLTHTLPWYMGRETRRL